jgi:RNA polymerase sigma-70 factor (ECF subfamily)
MIKGVSSVVGESASLDPDVQLMLQVREGDESSFGILVQKHRNAVVHFLYRMVLEQAVAEELAQEVFFRVYRSREKYEATAKFTTWMFRIATHLALNWLRDEKKERAQERLDVAPRGSKDGGDELPRRQVADGRRTTEQSMLYEAHLQEVRDAVAALPDKQRAAVLMHKYGDMEYSQIATVLECSESAVKSLLFRAYETLRRRLAHMARGGA